MHKMPKHSRYRRSFTMVEILGVLIIMIVLLTMGANVYRTMFRSSAVDSGARMLSAQLRLARQYAITKRKHVALLMPQDSFDSGSSLTNWTEPMRDEYRGSSIRPCIVDSSGTFVEYIDNTSWSFLPNGAYITDFTNQTSCSLVEFQNQPAADVNVPTVRAIIFKPNGSLTTSNLGDIEVVRATLNSQTISPINGGADKRTLSVNWLTGRISFN